MSTGERSAGRPPMYARLLRLRRIRITGLVSFLLMECTVAVAVLLALAELVSWWAVPLLPVLVAAVVKINDMVGAPANRSGVNRSEPTRERVESWDDDLVADERHSDQRHVDERHGHDGQPAWAADRQDVHQDWYADNPTQEIVLPTSLTGRPRQRSGDRYGEPDAYGTHESQPAYAGAGRAAYSDRHDAEPAYTDRSYAHAYAEPTAYAEPAGYAEPTAYAEPAGYAEPTAYAEPAHAGQGHEGYDGWGRHAASAATVEDTYAGQPARNPAGNRSRDAAALADAGRHIGARTAPGHRTGRGTSAGRGAAVGRARDDWAPAGDVESADLRTSSRDVAQGARTASRGVDNAAGGRSAAAGGATRPADYWTRAAGTDAAGANGGGVVGTGGGQAGMPAGVPGSSAPRRVQLLGAAVRRSMAAQAQQIGGVPSGGSGRSGTGNDTGSGRHSRGDSGGSTGRQKVRLNDRGFNRRLRDA